MRTAISVFVAGALLLAGCGSDDESSSQDAGSTEEPTEATEDPTEAATEEPTEATEEPTEATEAPTAEAVDPFCGDFIEAGNQVALMDAGVGDPEALVGAVQTAAASAPEEVSEDVEVMADFAQSGGQGDFDAFDAATANVLAWVIDNCAETTLDVGAVDYAYEDFPDSVEAGLTAINLDNQGAEFHEAAVLQVNDGVDMTPEELLALPDEELLTKATFMGAAFAEPGTIGMDIFDLSEPGNYVVACFIPVGATPEAAEVAEAGGPEPDGQPHFTEGMLEGFTVE